MEGDYAIKRKVGFVHNDQHIGLICGSTPVFSDLSRWRFHVGAQISCLTYSGIFSLSCFPDKARSILLKAEVPFHSTSGVCAALKLSYVPDESM